MFDARTLKEIGKHNLFALATHQIVAPRVAGLGRVVLPRQGATPEPGWAASIGRADAK